MNPKYVTSLQLSRQLKEAGLQQKSGWYWFKKFTHKDDFYLEPSGMPYLTEMSKKFIKEGVMFSAFHVGELGEMLPYCIQDKETKNFYYLTITHEIGGWNIAYTTRRDNLYREFMEDTEAEARGKMVLYLKENKVI